MSAFGPEGVCLSGVCPAPPDVLDFEKPLLDVSILPVIVTPIVDPVVGLPESPSSYPAPLLTVLPNDDPDPIPRISPLREVADSPILDVSPSYLVSPAGSVYELVTSPITPSLREDDAYRPPSSPATMNQYLSRDGDLLLGDSTDFPLLAMPLTPRPIVEEMVLGSSVGSPAGEPVAAPSHGMLDLSREDPFDVHQDASESGATLRVLDSLPGCQYRMTSYDEDVDRSDLSPAYGIHLHDPRLLEYVGAPESARLLSRSPEYWLHHMGRDRTMSANLQLQHDAGLILSNLQVLGQFVTSLNRMSSEVMRVAFAHKPFPTEEVQFVAPSHRVRRAAHYMAAMGLWRPPCTQGIPGPLPSSSCNACMTCSDCFPEFLKQRRQKLGAVFSPRGKDRGVVDIVFCVHQLPPHQTSAQKTFDMTLCDNVHSGDAICSCNCFIVASLRLVLVGWVSFLGIPVFLGMVVFMFLVVYRPFSLPLRVPTAARHIRFLLVRVFSGWPPCVG